MSPSNWWQLLYGQNTRTGRWPELCSWYFGQAQWEKMCNGTGTASVHLAISIVWLSHSQLLQINPNLPLCHLLGAYAFPFPFPTPILIAGSSLGAPSSQYRTPSKKEFEFTPIQMGKASLLPRPLPLKVKEAMYGWTTIAPERSNFAGKHTNPGTPLSFRLLDL